MKTLLRLANQTLTAAKAEWMYRDPNGIANLSCRFQKQNAITKKMINPWRF